MGDKEPYGSQEISHGMCQVCFEDFEKKWSVPTLGEFLDQFEVPILAVTEERRIIAVNQVMAEIMGREQREVFGLLGGEAMTCQYAQLQEGCGGSIHCKACTIRNAVLSTMRSGKPERNIPAHLDCITREVEFLISTRKEKSYVLLEINKIVGVKTKETTRA